MVALVTLLTARGEAQGTAFDVPVVNGHPGYLTAFQLSPDGIIDKVLIVVTGFDLSNDDHPIDDINDDYQPIIDKLGPLGWDVVIFDYVRGGIDLLDNADNLAHFIRIVDSVAVPDYHLAVVGGSMGGIVARAMFAQEGYDMGVDTFVSLDAPHHGVYLSKWLRGATSVELGEVPALLGAEGGIQMLRGTPAHDALYGWMRDVESSPGFMAEVIDPMSTLCIALSDGEGDWNVNWYDKAVHGKFHDVSSFIELEGLETDYMPYHSVCNFNDSSTSRRRRFGYTKYWYNDTSTSYFDEKQPNPKTEHGAPDFAVEQAVDFVLRSAPPAP
jgi:pimeloyl-ACP methyl ester carboxylesterase